MGGENVDDHKEEEDERSRAKSGAHSHEELLP